MKINEKNLCMFAVSPPLDLDGYLQKRGEVNRSWQRRYFVLKGNLLFYFEKRADREPLGLIVIEGCTIELSEDGEPYCFQIVFHGINNRTYYLSAESQTQMEQWMKALTCAGYEYMKLMVSELQRQLDELEGTSVPSAQSATAALTSESNAPQPPPRRQNPFNRSAPPPPHQQSHTNGVGGAPVVAPARSKNATNKSSASTPSSVNHHHYHNGGLVLSASQLLAAGVQSTPTEPVTFAALHEHFGRAIRRDLSAFWQQSDQPLIVL